MSVPHVGLLFFKLLERCLQKDFELHHESDSRSKEIFDEKRIKKRLKEIRQIFDELPTMENFSEFVNKCYAEFNNWSDILKFKHDIFLNFQQQQLHHFHHIYDDEIFSFEIFLEIFQVSTPHKLKKKSLDHFISYFLFFHIVQFVSFIQFFFFFFFKP